MVQTGSSLLFSLFWIMILISCFCSPLYFKSLVVLSFLVVMLHPSKESDHILNGVQTLKLISWIVFWWSSVTLCSFCIKKKKKHELEIMVQISSYFLALKVDTDVSLLFQRGCSWPSWMGVAVERLGWRTLIGLLLLRGGVVGGAGCCSLLCSETIKWTVISPGRLQSHFTNTFNPGGPKLQKDGTFVVKILTKQRHEILYKYNWLHLGSNWLHV